MKKIKDPITYEQIAAKFFSLLPVGRINAIDCWEWQGSLISKEGYGDLVLGNKRNKPPFFYRERPHRFSYKYFNKCEIPEGLHVCHKCDNPKCCNPLHLFLGTNLDNIADKMRKGRNFKGPNPKMSRGAGTQIYNAKLKESDIPKIFELRKSGHTYRGIAKQFGVSTGPICRVLNGKGWRHVERRSI